jgi:guanylate kinase
MERRRHGAPGFLFVVSGPSGAGKDTLVEALIRRTPGLRYSVSATTRAPRPGEVEGASYRFVSRSEFARLDATGEFLETKDYNGNLYGTPRSFVEQTLAAGDDVIVKPEVDGALRIKERFPQAVLIFLLPDSFSSLRARLEARRTETAAEISARLAIAVGELKTIRAFEYVVINEQQRAGETFPAVDDLAAILRAERFRSRHYDDQTFEAIARS